MSDCQLVFNSPDMYLILGTCLKILHHLSHALFIVFSLSCLSSHFLRRNFPVFCPSFASCSPEFAKLLIIIFEFYIWLYILFQISKVSDKKIDKIGKKFKVGTVHK